MYVKVITGEADPTDEERPPAHPRKYEIPAK